VRFDLLRCFYRHLIIFFSFRSFFFIYFSFFFFNDTATTEIYTLSLHDALPISSFLGCELWFFEDGGGIGKVDQRKFFATYRLQRSEEHTSELQSPYDLVCRLLLEKKKKTKINILHTITTNQKTVTI